jgi:hypothetical protein
MTCEVGDVRFVAWEMTQCCFSRTIRRYRVQTIRFGALLAAVPWLAVTPAAAERTLEYAQNESPPACGEPDTALSAQPGGKTLISIVSTCRAGQIVTFSYDGATFIKWMDAQGKVAFLLDCFAGASEPVTMAFEDNTKVARLPIANDIERYSKVAIVWSSSVDLDLHAFEHAAQWDESGHVWSGAPGSLVAAELQENGRGHGFLSTSGSGGEVGMNAEVYTYVHHAGEPAGYIKLSVDLVSRGDRATGEFCGSGQFAELHFKGYILEPGKPVRTLDVAFFGLPCGTDISHRARYNMKLIPDLAVGG